MQVKDRKMIARLMVVQGVTRRGLAEAAGWKSHGLLNRILSGEVTTVTPERAARIAKRLGVGTDDLFLARLSSEGGENAKSRSASKPRPRGPKEPAA